MIRTLWVYLNLLIATGLIAGTVVLAALLRVRGRVYDWAARSWSKWMLWASGSPVHVIGLDNVRRDRPQIFVSNHQSWFDIFALAAVIPKRYRFIAKKELGRIPIFGAAWKAAGHIEVNRQDRGSAIQSLEAAGRLIREDKSSVVIFPEGTRSPTGRLLPFKKGAFMLALHTGVDIVPVAVSGTRAILRKRDWRIRRGTITVRFGPAIPTAGYTEANREELIALVRGRIEAMLHQAPEARRAS
ncbi:MAG: 1-acyl-sn-glycerol-3-phosphate acyltransferase [Gemmatimonadetes bacterium]|nr:1-acyl-sn-glycerol-3-phosphate acyltransferase [Gemmatimonadota bacterium]